MPTVVHKNKRFKIVKLDLKNKKHKYNYYVMDKPDEVIILAFVSKDEILMEAQYRPAVKMVVHELPAGHINPNEKPEHAARRELEEETGYKAKNMKLLFKTHPSPGVMNSVAYTYLATDLSKGKLSLDENEKIKIRKMKFDRAMKYVLTRKIADQAAVVAMLYYDSIC
jgi:ADP-ribose pyrophosphatase